MFKSCITRTDNSQKNTHWFEKIQFIWVNTIQIFAIKLFGHLVLCWSMASRSSPILRSTQTRIICNERYPWVHPRFILVKMSEYWRIQTNWLILLHYYEYYFSKKLFLWPKQLLNDSFVAQWVLHYNSLTLRSVDWISI